MDNCLTDNLPVICNTDSTVTNCTDKNSANELSIFVNAGCTHMNSAKYFNFVVSFSQNRMWRRE